MKSIILSLMLGLLNSGPTQWHGTDVEQPMRTLTKMENTPVVNVAFFYLKNGKSEQFAKLRSRGGVILEKYGARIERVIKPTAVAAGQLDLPDEIHFAIYPNRQAMLDFNNDPEFIQLKEEAVTPSVEKMYGFVTQLSNFEFTREIGDNSKTYAVALVYLKHGKQFQEQFAEYHQEACSIIPEFGTHFERFLVPLDSKGGLAAPDELHRFYFDSPQGMQQMIMDSRMQQLFPKRDQSLSNLILILGKALQ